ncbi:MAG: hypothetical protein QNJ44_05010 [Rhodobacter sp.]|nr:hypothetical protein [Rhodobacter sp.]
MAENDKQAEALIAALAPKIAEAIASLAGLGKINHLTRSAFRRLFLS